MKNNSNRKDVTLDCSIDRFVNTGIRKEYALVLMSHLHYCIGDSNFRFSLKTENVFGSIDTIGWEEGNIPHDYHESPWEHAKRVEDGGICIAFLFFSNVMSVMGWVPVPRRGKGFDYSCKDSKQKTIVIEVGGRTSKYGAKKDLKSKIKRFQKSAKIPEPTYISSVGFEEGEHIVYRYN